MSTNTNDNLSDAMSDYDNMEQQLTGDLSSNLTNVDTTMRLSGFSSFVYASNFVKQQFDRFASIEPINLIITFSLILGLAMLIIGKRLL